MRLRQALVLALGVLAAAVMVVLGLWQMQVFLDQESQSAEARSQGDPVPLMSRVSADNAVDDVYGRRVTVQGTYLPSQQLVARDSADSARVLAALQLADGRVLPVVLGVLPDSGQVPIARGHVQITGVFLASDKAPDPVPVLSAGEVASVRLPALAQLWTQPLLPGYVTLPDADAEQLGLAAAPLALPGGEGSVRNEGYALQWWVFAAFALGVSVKISRDIGKGNAGSGRTMGVSPLVNDVSSDDAASNETRTSTADG